MKNFILKKFSLKNFTLKNFKRYVPASATVEAALVIPLVIYAVAAGIFLLNLISIKYMGLSQKKIMIDFLEKYYTIMAITKI